MMVYGTKFRPYSAQVRTSDMTVLDSYSLTSHANLDVCVLSGVMRFLLDCFLELSAGGARDRASLALTKTLALVCEINPGRQIDVPNLLNGQTVPLRCFAVIF